MKSDLPLRALGYPDLIANSRGKYRRCFPQWLSGYCPRKQDSTPDGSKSNQETKHDIECRNEKSPCLQAGERLPLKGRKGTIGSHESDWNQKPPGRIQFRAPSQERHREANNQAGCNVDDKGSVRKSGAHPIGNA